MPVRCAVCSECANGVDAIWGVDDKLLYFKKDSSRDIKNCTKASLRDSFPCWHNGAIIVPTNGSFVFYRVERNEEGLFPIEEALPATDCPTLDLPSTVTPDPLRPGENGFWTTPSPQGKNGFLIGGSIAGGVILILIVVFIYKKITRAGRTQVTTHDDSQL